MARKPIVVPKVITLQLSGGDTLTVKSHLTDAEEAMIEGGGLVAIKGDSGNVAYELSFPRMKQMLLNVYIVGWSFLNHDDSPLEVKPENIAALDPETANECREAIAAHRAQMKKHAANPSPASGGDSN